MKGIISSGVVTQIGFVVRDIDKSKKIFSNFLGMKIPENIHSGNFEITQTEYRGKKAPLAGCLLAFFHVNENLTIELIEPNGHPSAWQEFLDENGEGIHHIAFNIKGMKENILSCEKFGMELIQKGEYGDAGGRYAYLDAIKQLNIVIELLENDR
jgi:catechol 2,3-dioxygenase-like lactoylglutathione lyase family enzyme